MEQDLERQLTTRTFVAAGAGAGKTTNLVRHIAETFFAVKNKFHKSPRIVGTTFTRMAANEIKDRVARYAFDPKNSIVNEENKKQLFDFAYSENLNITTIHGICLQILTKKAHLLGYSPDLKVVSKSYLRFYERKTLFEIIEKENIAEIFEYFSFSDLLALFEVYDQKRIEFDRPANLGDLQEIYNSFIQELELKFTDHLLYLNELDYSQISTRPEEVVEFIKKGKEALKNSFSNKDLSELKDFFSKHSIPRQNISAKDKVLFDSFNSFKEDMRYIRDKVISEDYYAKIFDKTKYEMVVQWNEKLFHLYGLYKADLNNIKKQKSFVSMSEVEELTLNILKNYPEECQDYISMWDYWYIDEYQDTSPIQSEIFNILLQGKPYYKVGDPQQSIYLFRGAQASIFIQEMHAAQNDPEVDFKVLETNYRSHPNLMFGINELFAHITEKSEDISEAFKPMLAKDKTIESETSRLHFIVVEPKEDEQQFVIEKIKELNAEGVDLSEICILAHSKKILSLYEEELTKENVSCLAQFSGGFFERPEIQGLVCFLKVMDDPNQDIDLVTLLRTQNFKVEDDLLKDWMDKYKQDKPWSLWETLQKIEHPAIDKIKYFMNIFATKDYIIGIRSYFSESRALSSAYNSMDLARRKANILKAYSYACQKSETTNYDIRSLIEDIESGEIEELTSEAVFSESKNGVRLFTIHGSKGLEFKYVFLVGSAADKRGFPFTALEVLPNKRIFLTPIRDKSGVVYSTILKYFSKEERTTNEKKEARRVMYVAATRAKEHLYVVGGVKRTSKGLLSPGTESLYKIIDINSFLQQKWNFIDVNSVVSKSAEPIEILPSYQFLEFAPCENSKFTSDVPKKLFSRIKLNDLKRKEQLLHPRSVSQVVDLLSNQDFEYSEIRRQNFEKIDLTKVYGSDFSQSKLQMEIFLKPFVGDVFHKAIELYSKGVTEEDLNVFIEGYFPSHSSSVLNLIKNISMIKTPNMKDIFAHSNSEWGFNALYGKDTLLSGQIDLWGIDNNSVVHVLDYKTGSIRFLKKAAIQLGLYKTVLRQIYPTQEIQTHAIYPSEGVLVSLNIGQLPEDLNF